MKTAIVNEIINPGDTEWSVSFDGYNTSDNSQTVICKDKNEAFKLKAIIDDLKDKLDFALHHLSYRIDKSEIYENENQLDIIIDDIKAIYL